MKIYVIFLPNIWMKQKMNLFYKYEHKKKYKSFSNEKLKFNLEPGT